MHLVYWQFLALLTPIALSLGVISAAIMVRITRDPIRGCNDCGDRLNSTNGTHCDQCVERRQTRLDTEADYD